MKIPHLTFVQKAIALNLLKNASYTKKVFKVHVSSINKLVRMTKTKVPNMISQSKDIHKLIIYHLLYKKYLFFNITISL